MHLIAAGGVFGDQAVGVSARAYLAHSGNIGVGVEQRPQLLHHRKIFRAGFVIDMLLIAVRIGLGHVHHKRIVVWRVVTQLLVMNIIVHCVMPETVHAALQPKINGFIECLAHVLVMKIQVRLRCQKVMQIILAAACVPGPSRTAKNRQPIVGRRAVRFGVGPDKPIGLRVHFIGAAFLKPRVRVRRVGNHLINHHLQV